MTMANGTPANNFLLHVDVQVRLMPPPDDPDRTLALAMALTDDSDVRDALELLHSITKERARTLAAEYGVDPDTIGSHVRNLLA